MSTPTFNGTALFDAASRDLPGPVRPRMATGSLPGVNGLYVQLFGTGARTIRARGLLTADASAAAEAHRALKAALRARQALADGRTVAHYVGTDTTAYPSCVLLGYEADGELSLRRIGPDAYRATLPCSAELIQLTP